MIRRDWFLTATGRQVFVTDPQPEDIVVADIAQALSRICRFGGHVRNFYSVAQHSVWVSERLPERLMRKGLLHDAPEAYLGDVVRPLKRELPDYVRLEALWWKAICERFQLPEEGDAEVKAVDLRALMTERRDLTYHGLQSPYPWIEDEARIEPDPYFISPLGPDAAKHLFLERCAALGVR
jgi:hypothetical protein